MFIEILLAIIIGILLGIITGLTPGIHINLISVLMLSFSSYFLYIKKFFICIIIISMAITHTFLDTIPSIFLGAPEEETVLSILPGHKLLLQGQGYKAVMLTIIGSLGGLILCISIVPLVIYLIPIIYSYIKQIIGWLLLAVSIFLILKERTSKLWALIIFNMAGILGVIVLNMQQLSEPLFPLLSGLFGTSMLFLSLKANTNIPKQKEFTFKMQTKKCAKAVSASVMAGWICSFMPGLGPAQGAILISTLIKLEQEMFMVLVGGLSTVNMILSFVTLYTLDKARNGAIVAVSNLIQLTKQDLMIFLACALIVGGIATILAMNITKMFAKMMTKINYRILCASIIFLIIILCFYLSGIIGLIVLFISTCIGIIPQVKGIGRNHMMGCLLLPVMLYFLL